MGKRRRRGRKRKKIEARGEYMKEEKQIYSRLRFKESHWDKLF